MAKIKATITDAPLELEAGTLVFDKVDWSQSKAENAVSRFTWN